VVRWPIRIVSVIALTVLSFGWGHWFAAERPALEGILLALLTLVLLFALARLYRPGGLAAFAFDPPRASGEPIAETAGAARAAPRQAVRRDREPQAAAPPRARPRETTLGGSLWSGGEVDLNRARASELAGLPGVGSVWARRIVEDREIHGPFASVEDLARLDGFGPERLPGLEGRLRV